jgi:hypothetical protein
MALVPVLPGSPGSTLGKVGTTTVANPSTTDILDKAVIALAEYVIEVFIKQAKRSSVDTEE